MTTKSIPGSELKVGMVVNVWWEPKWLTVQSIGLPENRKDGLGMAVIVTFVDERKMTVFLNHDQLTIKVVT